MTLCLWPLCGCVLVEVLIAPSVSEWVGWPEISHFKLSFPPSSFADSFHILCIILQKLHVILRTMLTMQFSYSKLTTILYCHYLSIHFAKVVHQKGENPSFSTKYVQTCPQYDDP